MTKPHPTKRKLGIFPRKFKINSGNLDDGQYFYVYCEKLKKVDIKNIQITSNQVLWSDPYSWDVDTKNNWLLIQAHPKAPLVSTKKLMDDDGDLTITITFDPPDDPEDVVYADVEYEPEDPPARSQKKSRPKENKASNKKSQPAAKDHPG